LKLCLRKEIKKGYWIRFLKEDGSFWEGRVVWVGLRGFIVVGRDSGGWKEYVRFDEVVTWKWGKYG